LDPVCEVPLVTVTHVGIEKTDQSQPVWVVTRTESVPPPALKCSDDGLML
jgi:hypothetical protein